MFGRLQPYGQIEELQRKVGTLDRLLSRLSDVAEDTTRDFARRGRDTASHAFDDVAERFRGGAERFGKEATRLGHRATALGEMSLDRFAKQAGLHPYMVVGIALGLGAIIGAAQYRYATQNPPPPRRTRRVRKGQRK